jgi:collagenase-like PrtC family protease
MKFAVGYQEPENREPFSRIVQDYREHICDVYFALPGSPSGRADYAQKGSIDRLEEELAAIRRMKVKLDLLFNANCYGGSAISLLMEKKLCAVLDDLQSIGLLPDVLTTTSPYVAMLVRKHFPGVETRASVNMRIDSLGGMDYLQDLFDSFYIRRDLQRDLPTVTRFKEWCDRNGKKMGMLLNSGCLRNCPSQTFHDNLVAHDKEVKRYENTSWNPHLCWRLYQEKKRYVEFLKSSWIRPEDVQYYEGVVSFGKLATRQHHYPRLVIGAYAGGRFDGDLLHLTEPDYSAAFGNHGLDNSAFPADWHEHAGLCGADCRNCGYCDRVLAKVLRPIPAE